MISFSRGILRIFNNDLIRPVYTLSLTTRTFYSSQFKLESSSFPSLPSPPSFPTTTTLNSSGVSPSSSTSTLSSSDSPIKHAIGKIERRLQITFTCTATIDSDSTELETVKENDTISTATPVLVEKAEEDEVKCGHRSTHEFSKRSYDHGIVLIECPSCKNRHLIADNLQWFNDTPSPAHPKGLPLGGVKIHRTVEDLMREKGEKVKWLEGGANGGTWELEV